jgi:predicted phosphoribosyltransferase
MVFENRRVAGRRLAAKLMQYAGRGDVMVLALPRGGVPVGYEVARALGAPLDVFIVRKLGVPGHEELAMGAVASGGVMVVNRDLMASLGISQDELAAVAERELAELERRQHLFRVGGAVPEVSGRLVILVDDGLATGSTMLAAIAALRKLGPERIVVAVPVASPPTCRELASQVDEIVCAATPEPFFGVGQFYDDFTQTTDEEVRALLHEARGVSAAKAAREQRHEARRP